MNDQNQKWFTDRGDETRALDWPINSDSLVWEIGGFEGRWASQMVEKFNCRMDIFEPQIWAADKITQWTVGNNRAEVHPFGLWIMNSSLPIYNFETDGASILYSSEHADKPHKPGIFVDVYEWQKTRGDVDVALMNIEGAEFILLPYMIGLDLMRHFRFFWCQFHPGLLPHGDERANGIFKGMLRTHHKIWDYYPTAVAWERKLNVVTRYSAEEMNK